MFHNIVAYMTLLCCGSICVVAGCCRFQLWFNGLHKLCSCLTNDYVFVNLIWQVIDINWHAFQFIISYPSCKILKNFIKEKMCLYVV